MCIFFQTEEVCGKGFGITVVGMNKTTVKVMVRECYELPPSPPVAAAIATTSAGAEAAAVARNNLRRAIIQSR